MAVSGDDFLVQFVRPLWLRFDPCSAVPAVLFHCKRNFRRMKTVWSPSAAHAIQYASEAWFFDYVVQIPEFFRPLPFCHCRVIYSFKIPQKIRHDLIQNRRTRVFLFVSFFRPLSCFAAAASLCTFSWSLRTDRRDSPTCSCRFVILALCGVNGS